MDYKECISCNKIIQQITNDGSTFNEIQKSTGLKSNKMSYHIRLHLLPNHQIIKLNSKYHLLDNNKIIESSTDKKFRDDTVNIILRNRSIKIEVISPKLGRMNSWNFSDITAWLRKPVGRGEGMDDYRYEIRGKVHNCPSQCHLRIWILYLNEYWPQVGGNVSDIDGSWKGFVYLKIDDPNNMIKRGRVDMGIDLFRNNSNTPMCSEVFTIQ